MIIANPFRHPPIRSAIETTKTFLRDDAYIRSITTECSFDPDLIKSESSAAGSVHLIRLPERQVPKLPASPNAALFKEIRRLQPVLKKHHEIILHKFNKHKNDVGYKDECATLTALDKAIREHPAYDADFGKLAPSIKGYYSRHAFNDRWHAMNVQMGQWLRENRWAGVPIGVAGLILKLTVGIWILHQFDKLFGTRAAKGDPFMQDPSKSSASPESHHRKHRHAQANEDPRNFGNTQLGVLNTPYPPAGNVGQNPAVQSGYSPASTGAGLVTSPALGSLNYA